MRDGDRLRARPPCSSSIRTGRSAPLNGGDDVRPTRRRDRRSRTPSAPRARPSCPCAARSRRWATACWSASRGWTPELRRARPRGGRRVRRAPGHRRALRRRPRARHLRGAQPDRPRDARRRRPGDRRARLHRRRDRVGQRPARRPASSPPPCARRSPALVSEIRFSIFDLRHQVTDGPAVRRPGRLRPRGQPRDTGLRVHLSLDESGPPLSPRTATEVLRVAQEAIGNVRKHARADEPLGHPRLRRRRPCASRSRTTGSATPTRATATGGSRPCASAPTASAPTWTSRPGPAAAPSSACGHPTTATSPKENRP